MTNPFSNYTSWTADGKGGYTQVGSGKPPPGITVSSPSSTGSQANVMGFLSSPTTTSGSPSPSSPTTTSSNPSTQGSIPSQGLDMSQQSAWVMLQDQLNQMGLSSLTDVAKNYYIQGYTTDSIPTLLQEEPAYKQRFAGNEIRVKNGLGVLSPADYIATENAYRQVMQQYGLPSGYYDQSSDFANFIGNDMSASELQSRAQDAQAVWLNTDPTVKQAWSSYYGLSDGAAIASILDPEKALPIIQRMTTASQIGGAALNNNMSATTAARAEYLADQGITQAQAQKGYGDISQSLGYMQQAASRFGTSWSQTDAENATLLNQGAAQKQQSNIADAEKALFGARGAADQNTTATRSTGSY